MEQIINTSKNELSQNPEFSIQPYQLQKGSKK